MSGYVLHLPEEESVVLSGPAARRLVSAGNGDAALLYIALVQNRGAADGEKLRAALGWSQERFAAAFQALESQGLVGLPQGQAPSPAPPPVPAAPREEPPEYTRADMARALEGEEFRALTRAVEEKLGKKLTTPDVGTLLGLYDYVGLPSDVIFLLVGYCCERTAQRYGPGRRPTLRQIEREGYTWARLGLMDQDRAAAYIRDRQRQREALPRLMALLRLGDRPASPSEEKYLLSWAAMGFEDSAIERAYDKTILKCKELKWPYMNKILTSWHEKGLHTLREVEDGDRPAPRRQAPQPQGAQAREDMARMERYLQRLREQSKGKEGA